MRDVALKNRLLVTNETSIVRSHKKRFLEGFGLDFKTLGR